MTLEERALLLATAFFTAKVLAESGFVGDGDDLYAMARAAQTAEERMPHMAAIKDLDKK